MCPKTPNIPKPDDYEPDDEELQIDDNQDQEQARSARRGTRSLQIGLNSAAKSSGLGI